MRIEYELCSKRVLDANGERTLTYWEEPVYVSEPGELREPEESLEEQIQRLRGVIPPPIYDPRREGQGD